MPIGTIIGDTFKTKLLHHLRQLRQTVLFKILDFYNLNAFFIVITYLFYLFLFSAFFQPEIMISIKMFGQEDNILDS